MPTRRVRFFEILDADGSQMEDINWDDFLDAVEAMPEADAYVDIARMELLGSTYRPQGGGAKKTCGLLILDRITREVRIRIENRRNYRPLELGPGDTLADPTHFGLFPGNVVGIIRVGNSTPSHASLRDFINSARILDDEVEIKPLVDLNSVRALGDVDHLTKLELELDTAAAESVLPKQSKLHGLFKKFREDFGGVKVDVIIKVDRNNHEASETALAETTAIINNVDTQSLSKASITYRSIEQARSTTFDFLGEAVAKGVDVELDESGGEVTDLSASQGIAKAYDDLYDDIQSALKGTPDLT